MVSFWPWRGETSSTANFEKTLSQLFVKISQTQTRLEKVRSRSRRVKVLTTLYLGFAYLVYAIVETLVVGYKNMGPYEWTGIAGGPVLIYVSRMLLTKVYNYRIESLSIQLKEQQTERTKTIQKLKDATKYDSTLELISKYGGVDGKPKDKKLEGKGDGEGQKGSPQQQQQKQGRPNQPQPGRTNMPPPPTANIQRRPVTPSAPLANRMDPTAEFAPNADVSPNSRRPAPSQTFPQPIAAPEGHWYDRIFDVLLGEDESAPKNRIVLICGACRLVNGQAPPGTRSLGELGVWRCMGCGTNNGRAENEGQRIVREVLDSEGEGTSTGEKQGVHEVEPVQEDDESTDSDEISEDEGPAAAVKRRRAQGRK